MGTKAHGRVVDILCFSQGRKLSAPWIAFRFLVVAAWAASVVLIRFEGFPAREVPTFVAMALLAAFAVTALLGKKASIILTFWIAAIGALCLDRNGVIMLAAWSAIGVALIAGRKHLFAATKPRGSWVQALVALQMCFILLFGAESLARLARPLETLLVANSTLIYEDAPFSADNPTLITLGSSPATTEVISNQTFSRILSDRLMDVANFRIARTGGVDSAIILKLAAEAWKGDVPIDGIMLYAGFQDFNQNRFQKALRHVNILGSSNIAVSSVSWLLKSSSLFNVMIEKARGLGGKRSTQDEELEAKDVFRRFKANIRQLLDMAKEHGTKVFVITIVPDSKRLSHDRVRYSEWVNDFYLSLPQEYSQVTVVPFASAFAVRYPDGRLPDGTPFEVSPDGQGRLGDPYHLGKAGHILIADTIEPEIRRWAATWRSEK